MRLELPGGLGVPDVVTNVVTAAASAGNQSSPRAQTVLIYYTTLVIEHRIAKHSITGHLTVCLCTVGSVTEGTAVAGAVQLLQPAGSAQLLQ